MEEVFWILHNCDWDEALDGIIGPGVYATLYRSKRWLYKFPDSIRCALKRLQMPLSRF